MEITYTIIQAQKTIILQYRLLLLVALLGIMASLIGFMKVVYKKYIQNSVYIPKTKNKIRMLNFYQRITKKFISRVLEMLKNIF